MKSALEREMSAYQLFERTAGVTADLDPPRIWTPGPNPQADMDPPGPNPLADMDLPSQIWTPLQNVSFKHRLYHTWSLILFGSFLPIFFSITKQHSSVKVKKNSHFVPILPHVL